LRRATIAYRVNKNKEIMAYYIHRALKFATSDNKAEPDSRLHTLGNKIATSANKHADKIIYKTDNTSIEFKKG
jgi:hypothetical protein